jgi:hypothetical protein
MRNGSRKNLNNSAALTFVSLLFRNDFTSLACEFSKPLLFTRQKPISMEVMLLIFFSNLRFQMNNPHIFGLVVKVLTSRIIIRMVLIFSNDCNLCRLQMKLQNLLNLDIFLLKSCFLPIKSHKT